MKKKYVCKLVFDGEEPIEVGQEVNVRGSFADGNGTVFVRIDNPYYDKDDDSGWVQQDALSIPLEAFKFCFEEVEDE